MPFFVGLVSLPFLVYKTVGTAITIPQDDQTTTKIVLFDEPNVANGELSIIGWILGGFLVGIGTKMGNGCTSGHGVCGLPRWSKRSWIAVPVFMGTGFIMATIRDQTDFLKTTENFVEGYSNFWNDICSVVIVIILFMYFIYFIF